MILVLCLLTILYYGQANGRSVSQGDGLRRRRHQMRRAAARYSCSGRLADDRSMSGLRLIASGDSLLNYNVAVSIVVQLYSCCYQFKWQICLTCPCASTACIVYFHCLYVSLLRVTLNIIQSNTCTYAVSPVLGSILAGSTPELSRTLIRSSWLLVTACRSRSSRRHQSFSCNQPAYGYLNPK